MKRHGTDDLGARTRETSQGDRDRAAGQVRQERERKQQAMGCRGVPRTRFPRRMLLSVAQAPWRSLKMRTGTGGFGQREVVGDGGEWGMGMRECGRRLLG